MRIESVLALGLVGKAGMPALVTALKDKESEVRFQTVATIGKLGADVRQVFGDAIRSLSFGVKLLRPFCVLRLQQLCHACDFRPC